MIVVAADVARRRKEKGLKLNYPESVALITNELLEGAREGREVKDFHAPFQGGGAAGPRRPGLSLPGRTQL